MNGFSNRFSSEDAGKERIRVVPENDDRTFAGHGPLDAEFFIRKTFQSDAQKGCELLFQRYYKPMCSHAVRFVYSKDIAEDIVAEIFCNFWDNRAFETVHTTYASYLFGAVRNRCFNYLQKEQNKTLPLDAAVENDPTHSVLPEKIMQYDELYHQVNTLVQQLPAQCQKVFIMNRFEGKGGKEIASELSLSRRTVEAHIARALSLLRNGLRHYWVETLLLLGVNSSDLDNIFNTL